MAAQDLIPDELAAALARRPELERAFTAMSASHRSEYARWVGEAKRPETRASRAEKALAMIAERAAPGT